MNVYIALFRGINVGGNNSLPMKELSDILAELGCKNIKTYIQSGNAIFQSGEKDAPSLSDRIRSAVEQRCGFAPSVLLLRLAELEKIVAGNPFPEGEAVPQSLHVGFLTATPKAPDLKKLESLREKGERFHLTDRAFYLHAPNGIGRSKLAAASEKSLGVAMTDRNWRTTLKLLEMAKEKQGTS